MVVRTVCVSSIASRGCSCCVTCSHVACDVAVRQEDITAIYLLSLFIHKSGNLVAESCTPSAIHAVGDHGQPSARAASATAMQSHGALLAVRLIVRE